MLLQAHAGQRDTSVAQATSLVWLIWSEPAASHADRLPAPRNPAKKFYGGNYLYPAGRLPRVACPLSRHRAALTTRPVDSTSQRSLLSGLPLSRAISQSATSVGGNGPRLAAGTLPTECRLSA